MDIFFAVRGLIAIGVWIAIIYFLSSWQETKAKTLLFGCAVLMAVSSVGFFLLGPVNRIFDSAGFFPPDLRNTLSLVLNLAALAGTLCLLGYVIVEGRLRQGTAGPVMPQVPQSAPTYRVAAADRGNPYFGVKGWLKFVVVVYIYVIPTLFMLGQLAAWTANVTIASRYPGVVVTGLIDTIVWGYLVYRGIQVGIGLRDLRLRAVQETRKFLIACLVWGILSIPVSFFSGLEPHWLAGGAVRTLLSSIIGFAIWYSYFNVSRRVEATYPDWKERAPEIQVATPGPS